MLGAFITLAFCFTLAAAATKKVGRWAPKLDSAARVGIGGLVALGLTGTILLPVGLIPGGVRAIPYVGAAFLLIAIASLVLQPAAERLANLRFGKPERAGLAFALALGLAFVVALVGCLSPADALEWDSLAYHLAVPKLWIEAGQIVPVPFIHHSNFPFAIDNLYLLGLQAGGQAGAKAFVLAMATLGVVAIFGLARQVYGQMAGWWAALTFATAPVVLWLSGTAYIDVPNGLYAGLGIALAALYAREPSEGAYLWLSGLCLGLAAGSKYTGLQTIAAVGFAMLAVCLYRRAGGRFFLAGCKIAAIALVVASPWYIKNFAWTGNPVYPFFYERLGGRNWGPDHARIYKHEQQTFGVGQGERGRDWSQVGPAILGLAYQPGRYINPGQQTGQGNPLGAVGVAVMGSLVAWCLSGRAKSFEATCLIAVGISLAMWFALSQQSRYIVTLAVPLAILLGGGAIRFRAGPLLGFIAAAQALYSIYLYRELRLTDQLRVLTGQETAQEYLARRAPFSASAGRIDELLGKSGKVALYDEVFGYFLDVPYFWANPGHSAVIPYGSMRNGGDFARELSLLGFTHVYISLSPIVRPREQAAKILSSFGLASGPTFSSEERGRMMGSFEQRFLPLLVEAAETGQLQVVDVGSSGVLLRIESGEFDG